MLYPQQTQPSSTQVHSTKQLLSSMTSIQVPTIGTLMSDKIEHEAAIARLVAGGHMTHEKAGQYPAEHVSKRGLNSIPDYDAAQVRAEFPTVKTFDFDEDKDGCFAMMRDGMTDETVRVPMGANPPATTADLIVCVREYYRSLLNTDALAETAALFEAMEKDI